MSALAAFRHPVARVVRGRTRWLPVLAWSVLAVLVAVLARRQDHAVFVALSHGFGAVTLPLVAFAVLGLVCPEGSLGAAAKPLVFLGASARRASLAVVLTAALVGALVCAAVAALVVVVAHGPTDPPLARDAAQSAAIGALGGAAYVAYFSFGSAILGASGRSVFLVADLLLAGAGVGAILTPRAHVRSLFGGELAGHLAPRTSFVALAILLAVFVLLVVARPPRK